MSGRGVVMGLAGISVLLVTAAIWQRNRLHTAGPQGAPAPPPSAATFKSGPANSQATASSLPSLDIFFLSEASAAAPEPDRPRGRIMRQPPVNGSRKIVAPRAVTSKDEGHFIAPRWSPDGLELLFTKPGHNGLYTKGLDGGRVNQVTDREGVGFRAAWNADGRIETRDNAGESQSFHPDGTPVDAAAYEADASLVGAFTRDDAVYLRSAPGEAPREISPAGGADRYYGGTLSPDRQWIVYNGLHTGLYIAPADGSAAPTSLGEGYSPSWLPDSSGIVYNISQDDGHNILASDLYLTSRDGATVSNLTATPRDAEINPAVSPDGGRVAYEQDGVLYVGQLQ